MRIFYDHQLFSLQDAGGAARYYYELIRHIQPYPDIEIEISLGLNRTIYPFYSLKGYKARISGRRSPIRPGLIRYSVNEILNLPLAVRRFPFDVYHSTFYRATPFVRRHRVVVTHHDATHERYPEMFRNSSVIIRNKQKVYASAHAIICVSESSKRDLLEYYSVDPGRVFVVHHGFSPFAPESAASEFPDWLKRPYLLFVGFRGTYKNFDALLRAYAESGIARDYDLVTVGGGPFSKNELAAAQSFGVASRLKNIQGARDGLLAKLYERASLFVYPSLHEGFGFPPLEAMSMGCPVLANATSSMPEICGDAAFYFKGEGLTRALLDVLNDNDSLAIKRERGYEQIRSFSWARAAAATRDIYINAVKN